jgi:2-phosphoglycerate kinase
MNKLYLVGGPPRVGKSIIMHGFLQQRPMHHISMDAVQEGVKQLFNDDPFQKLSAIHYEGWVEYKKRGTSDQVKHKFSEEMNEFDLARKAIIGMLDHYERSKSDVAIEGLHVTPEWVHSLRLSNYTIVPAFVGYTNPDYIEGILEHARNNEHDWINEWLSILNGDDTKLRAWATKTAEACQETAKLAKKYGYPFFDASSKPFSEYVADVQSYLNKH